MSEKIEFSTQNSQDGDVRSAVREHYGQIAEQAVGNRASCCSPQGDGSGGCCTPGDGPASDASIRLYETPEVMNLPVEVTALSLGCGDPVTLASLDAGLTVLDLGSGGGIDCFLAAKQVGPQGFVIGVDMTPQMLEKARRNQARLGVKNVDFRLGEIEHLPVADASVDVIISNCVINLSPDKPQVFREAFRVLKPGGRLSVSDIVTDGPLPEAIKASLSAWAGCVAGALDVREYTRAIEAAGFVDVSLTPVYFDQQMVDEAINLLGGDLIPVDISKDAVYKTVFSAKITARK